MLIKFLVWLVKIGILKAPKKSVYVVGIYVTFGDNKTLHRIPAEIYASSKITAKREVKKRCFLKVKGVVNKIAFSKDGDTAQFLVDTTLMLDENKILQKFTSEVTATSKEAAKWKLKENSKIKIKGVLKKSDIIKYNK